ncbi:MAG: hypothetical protein R3B82_26270 [Sandaracinaceae bacterium]
MKKIAFLAALGALALTPGCGGGRSGSDAGGIVLMDSGPGMMGTDAGPGMMGTDAGPGMMGGCSVAGAAGFPPLPAACLPRCSAATLNAINMCTDAACQQAALDADTTAPVNVDVGGGMSESIDCSGCFNWMINACIFDSCPTEFGACIECSDLCDSSTAGCETEEAAFDSCITTNMTALQSCVNSRAAMCFSTSAPFFPSFDRPEFQLPQAVFDHVISDLGVRIPQ